LLDVARFNDEVVGDYNTGTAEKGLPADLDLARSLVPAGTGALRDFSYIAPDIPEFIASNCVGCMECVTECPDTAILGKAIPLESLEKKAAEITDEAERNRLRAMWIETTKYYKVYEKKGEVPALFGIFIDPTKCKGCAECVAACGDHQALKMIRKNPAPPSSIPTPPASPSTASPTIAPWRRPGSPPSRAPFRSSSMIRARASASRSA
jgi:ferredoxin